MLVDDTCSRCTIKPTTLYYYGYNYCECFFHVDQLVSEGCFLIVLNLHNKHAMKHFLLKWFFCSCLVFIQRFHKVAVLYQSITKIRAKAKEEGKCEMNLMRKPNLVLRHSSLIKKMCTIKSFLPNPPKPQNKY